MLHDYSSTQQGAAPPPGAGEGTSREEPAPPPGAQQGTSQEGNRQVLGRRARDDSDDEGAGNLTMGQRKRPALTDPLVGCGRHFCRTIHAFCRVYSLLKDGLLREMNIRNGVLNRSDLTPQEQRENSIYKQFLGLSADMEPRISQASTQELQFIAGALDHGMNRARTDDLSSTKGAILDWITPEGGLHPTLHRNKRSDRGFFHYRTGELLCPPTLNWGDEKIREKLRTGELIVPVDCWSRFAYDGTYNDENPWEGLWRGELLVKAFKHVFICPSSADEDSGARTTRAGNAQIHGMKKVTIPSLAYIAMIVRLNLSSCENFNRQDKLIDSEGFYRSVIRFLEDLAEREEVDELLKWWNLTIFPHYHSDGTDLAALSAIPSVKDRIREWRKEKAQRERRSRPPLSDLDLAQRPSTSNLQQ